MSVRKIEQELAVVAEKLVNLRRQISELEAWEGELRTSLRVLERLGASEPANEVQPARLSGWLAAALEGQAAHKQNPTGQPDTHTVTHQITVRDSDGQVTRRTIPRDRPLATGVPLQAGQALIAMLRAKGDFIKQMEAVERLRHEHGIQIGPGRPGRETSDLSAAIGHGRVPGLVVSRAHGWGLEEWNGIPPSQRQALGAVRPEYPVASANDPSPNADGVVDPRYASVELSQAELDDAMEEIDRAEREAKERTEAGQ